MESTFHFATQQETTTSTGMVGGTATTTSNERSSPPIAPPSSIVPPQILSIPNPKRATSIDFLRFESHVTNSVLNGSPQTHQGNHHGSLDDHHHHLGENNSVYDSMMHSTQQDNAFASSGSLGLGGLTSADSHHNNANNSNHHDSLFHPFASTSIGVIGEKKTPPPTLSNNNVSDLLHPMGWKSPSEDLMRHLTPPPTLTSNPQSGNGLSSWANSANDLSSLTHSTSFIGSDSGSIQHQSLFDDSKWPFAERPAPGSFMNRASSSIGFGSAQGSTINNSLVGNLISRPLSTPIYPTNSLLGVNHPSSGLGFPGQQHHHIDDMFASFGLGSNVGLGGQQNSLGLGNANNFDSLLSSLNIRGANGMDNNAGNLGNASNMNAAFGGMSNLGGLGGGNPNSLYMNHNLRTNKHGLNNHNNNNMHNMQSNNVAFNGGGMMGKDDVQAWPKPVRYGNNAYHNHGFRPGMDGENSMTPTGLDSFSNSARIASPNNMHHGKFGKYCKTFSFINYCCSLIDPIDGHGSRRPHSTTPSSASKQHNNINRTMSPKISIQNLDERAIENVIATNCYHILIDAADHSLKAVELANTLRARVGTEVLAVVRERWGGLLSLLERHTERFLVERIPKNDRVSLKMKDENNNSTTVVAAESGAVASNSNVVASTNVEADNHVSMEGESVMPPQSHNSEDDNRQGTNNHDQQLNALQDDDHNIQLSNESFDELTGGGRSLSNEKDPFGVFSNSLLQQTGGYSFDPQNQMQATRCLHVGNVPSSYTEIQLVREFEKFGQIDGLKLISQKNGNRRFAFVTFKTVAQAVTARHCLSKIHPWKSAISFAHKELVNKVMHGGSMSVSGGVHHNNKTGFYGDNSTGNNVYKAGNNNMFHSSPDRIGSPQPPGNTPSVPSYSSIVEGHNATVLFPEGKPTSPSPNNYRNMNSTTPGGSQQQGHHLHNGNNATSGREQVVLQRLCDDTYVPTQPWPVDTEVDLPFCRAVVDQIAQFGGSTTVSKLRGFLKHRVGTIDNIKSVPLKAMLTAYPSMFKVEGNFVSLVSATNSTSTTTSSASSAVNI